MWQSIYDIISNKLFNKTYKLESNKTFVKFLDRFSKMYGEYGEDLVWDYLLFQFEHYDGQENRKIEVVQPAWVFGDLAIDRWSNKRDSWKHFSYKFMKKWGIKHTPTSIKRDMQTYYDNLRLLFYGSDSGFLLCVKESLFSEVNHLCERCLNFERCKIYKT